MIAVFFIFSHFLAVLAVTLGLVALAAPLLDETELFADYLIAAGLLGFVSVAMILAIRGRERRLRRRERFTLALALWLGLPLFAMLPTLLTLPGIGWTAAYFDAVSALTTTGASILPPPEQLPRLLVLWHATLQWLGGALTLLIIASTLAYAGLGGLPETQARQIEHGGEDEFNRLIRTLRELMPVYAGFSLISFLALALTGLSPFEAWCLAGTAISTGGMLPVSGDLTVALPPATIWIFAVTLIIGASSILWQRDLFRGRVRLQAAHRESYVLVASVIILGLAVAALLYRGGGGSLTVALREGFFASASLISTSGIELRPGIFQILPPSVVLSVILVGAASFSTAGGIKLFRLGAMTIQTLRELTRLIYPHSVRQTRFGTESYDMEIMKAVWSHFAVVVLVLFLVAAVLTANGIALDSAILASAATVSNAGPVFPAAIDNETATYADLNLFGRFAVILGMALGRVEVVLALSLAAMAMRRR